MRSWGLLAGLAAILAALVLAGGEAVLAKRMAGANGALARYGASASRSGTPGPAGFFAGVGVTSPL